eukprot:COSAG03_NODE_19_length_21645_cov_17.937532_4_plen_203_part_00
MAAHTDTELPGTQVATLEGSSFGIKIQGGREVQVIGEYSQALVTQADLVASNGVVHIIDDLLLPFRNEREWQEQIDQVPCGSGDGASTQPSSTQCGDLDSRVAIVNQACCDELGGSYCAEGVPRGCNSGCARVLLPLFAECIDAFGTSAPTFANQFAGVAAIIMRTGVHEYVLGPRDNERRERWVSTTLRGVRTLIRMAICQ